MRWRMLSGLGMLLAVAATPMAAEVDSYLPNDSEIVVSVNVEQIMASPLGQRYLRGVLQEALKSNEQGAALLKQVGFDPAKDVSRITIAMSGSEAEKSFVILRGKFSPNRVAEVAGKIAVDQKDKLKIHRIAGQPMYELAADKDSTFAAFASDAVLLLSTQRPALVAALEKSSDKFGKLKPALADLVAKADAKQAAWFAAMPGMLPKDLPIPQSNPQQKQGLDKLQGITGSVEVETEVRLRLTLASTDAAGAKQIAGAVDGVIKLLLFLAPGIVKEKPELAPLQDVLATIKSYSKGQSVHVTAEVTPKVIEKMIKLALP